MRQEKDPKDPRALIDRAKKLTEFTLVSMLEDATAVQEMFADTYTYMSDSQINDADLKENIEDFAIENEKRIQRLNHYRKEMTNLFEAILDEIQANKYYQP